MRLLTRKPSLVGLPRPALAEALGAAGLSGYRVDQVYRWLYVRGARAFDEMTDLPRRDRAALAERFSIARPGVSDERLSADGSRKWLLGLADGGEIETVYIPEADRGTLCVSSQIGCTLTCRFCHTGTQRLVRNLDAGEIVGQIMHARDVFGEWSGRAAPLATRGRHVSNIVLMGMGEPLYNFDNVKAAMAVATDGDGLAISKRRITLSTAGVAPMMDRCGDEIGVNLAVSLHAVTDELRNELVPLNRKYPLKELMAACRRYPTASNVRRITFEYVMLAGVNDSPAEARALARLIAGIPAKVNLIPFNPWPGSPYACSTAGGHPALLRHPCGRRLHQPGAHPARPGHPGGLRAVEIREPAAHSAGTPRGGPGDGACSPGGGAMSDEVKRVVLAYSGGLDTSVILHWLRETYRCEVVTFTADLGQGEELEPARVKAEAMGVQQIYIDDLREEFVRDFVFPMFRANALYEGQYLLGTSIARPLIARRQIEIARETGADAVSHGATGKGNDQVRFELSYYALEPRIRVIAPWREWDLGSRNRLIAYAEARQIPIARGKRGEPPYSTDANLLHISYEGRALEDPWVEPDEEMFTRTVSPAAAPDEARICRDRFRAGRPGGGGRRAPFARLAAGAAERGRRPARGRAARPGGEPLRRHEEPGRLRDARRHLAAGGPARAGEHRARPGRGAPQGRTDAALCGADL